jgi:hypothetical protein
MEAQMTSTAVWMTRVAVSGALLLWMVLGDVSVSISARGPTIPVTAHITADNHYALYYGDAAGINLTLIGRNESGFTGDVPGTAPWNLPETWNFTLNADDYIYVVAWDDDNTGGGFRLSMWIGDFTGRGRHLLVSNHENWESKAITNGFPGPFGDPDILDVMSAISSGSWSKPQAEAANLPGFVWGIPDVDPSAKLVWHNPFWGTTTPYVVFRAPASALRNP